MSVETIISKGIYYPIDAKSKDGNYKVYGIYSEPDSKGNKFIRLIHNDYEIYKFKTKRPKSCKVANNGTVLIYDSLDPNKLESKLIAYNNLGKMIFNKVFKAIIDSIEISDSGKYGICQNCHNSKSKHDNLLTLIDLNSGNIIYDLYSPIWADEYEFNENIAIVILHKIHQANKIKFVGLDLNYSLPK